MAIRWRLATMVVLVNMAICLSMFGIQQIEVSNGTIPPHGSIIPGTNQVFSHWQDWASLTYGDLLGLALVQVAFVHLWLGGHITSRQKKWLAVLIVMGCVWQYWISSRPLHKPDCSYPVAGHPSWVGVIHTIYFGLNVGIAGICIYHCLPRRKLRGWLLAMALFGGGVWIASFGYDIWTGQIDDLRPEVTEHN